MNAGVSNWLVAYGANTADHKTYVCAASRLGVRCTRQVVSDFAQQHFVRGRAYFYTLPLTSTGQTRQMNVVGYLPEFERSPQNESRVFHAYAAFMPGEGAEGTCGVQDSAGAALCRQRARDGRERIGVRGLV